MPFCTHRPFDLLTPVFLTSFDSLIPHFWRFVLPVCPRNPIAPHGRASRQSDKGAIAMARPYMNLRAITVESLKRLMTQSLQETLATWCTGNCCQKIVWQLARFRLNWFRGCLIFGLLQLSLSVLSLVLRSFVVVVLVLVVVVVVLHLIVFVELKQSKMAGSFI